MSQHSYKQLVFETIAHRNRISHVNASGLTVRSLVATVLMAFLETAKSSNLIHEAQRHWLSRPQMSYYTTVLFSCIKSLERAITDLMLL